MQYRHLFPMVRVLMPFMAGIIISVSLNAIVYIPFSIWVSLLLLTITSIYIPLKKLKFIKQLIFGILLSFFLFVTGYNSVLLHKEILRPSHFANTNIHDVYIASVSEPLQEKEHSYKSILQVVGLKKGNRLVKAEGRILVYFAKDSIIKMPEEGSTIVFKADVKEIDPPMNPGSFNYRKYMAANNVYHQVYLNNYSWKTLKNPEGFSVFRTAHQISRKFVNILNANGLKGREFAVASALILGQNDMLDSETMQAYSGSGVMHILSVSGLHVGVIFIIINFLLGFMKKEGRQLYLKTFIILITIWAYALLTGLSPSVMRSAAMFTFISFGNASKRNVHIINSLAVSALVLLLIDPLMISNVGFQLSYIAILGIVFINKPIADLWQPDQWITKHIWGLITVSIAAQIATAPLAMLYFHQFPMYFIPANLVAIDVSFFAILSGIAVLVTSFIPFVSSIFGVITNYLLFAMNFCVSYIEKLPYSVMHFTSIFTIEVILIYCIIISIILLFYFKKKEYIYLTLLMILAITVKFTITEIDRGKQQKIVFYSAGKLSALGFIDGKKQILLADSALIKDKKANKFQLEGTANLYGIQFTKACALDTITDRLLNISQGNKSLSFLSNYLLFHNKRIIILDSIPKLIGSCYPLKTDFLLIRQNPKLYINSLNKLYQAGMIIFDGSNSIYKTNKWAIDCKKAGLKSYSTKDDGAYVVDL